MLINKLFRITWKYITVFLFILFNTPLRLALEYNFFRGSFCFGVFLGVFLTHFTVKSNSVVITAFHIRENLVGTRCLFAFYLEANVNGVVNSWFDSRWMNSLLLRRGFRVAYFLNFDSIYKHVSSSFFFSFRFSVLKMLFISDLLVF